MAILALDHNHHDLSDLLNKHIKAFAKDEQKRIVAEAKAEEKRLVAEAKAEEKRLVAEAKAEEKRLVAEEKTALKRAKLKGDQSEIAQIKSKFKVDIATVKAAAAAQKVAEKKKASVSGKKKEIAGFDAGKSAAAHGGATSTSTIKLALAWASLIVAYFPAEGDFSTVILSYQTNSLGKDIGKLFMWAMVRCAFFGRNLHSRMPLDPMPARLTARLKLLHACDQWHSSRVSTFLTSSHCNLRPNTEGQCTQAGSHYLLQRIHGERRRELEEGVVWCPARVQGGGGHAVKDLLQERSLHRGD
jgi:hypothetical protein